MDLRCKRKPAGGFTLLELLVAVAIVIVLAGITFQVTTSMVENANLTRATQKIKDLGQAFVDYTSDHGGRLPLENADVPNISADSEDWTVAASEEAEEAWYNVLPERMGFPSVAELGVDNAPSGFYDPAYPIFLQGAPYHSGDKKLERPYFSVGMNSRLQRRRSDGYKDPGTLASIQQPVNTVIFQGQTALQGAAEVQWLPQGQPACVCYPPQPEGSAPLCGWSHRGAQSDGTDQALGRNHCSRRSGAGNVHHLDPRS